MRSRQCLWHAGSTLGQFQAVLGCREAGKLPVNGLRYNVDDCVAGLVQAPAGAAIGTVLLPGVGTGVGAKAGQMIEGLFGKKK